MKKPNRVSKKNPADVRPACVSWDAKIRQCVHPKKPHGRFPGISTCRRICQSYEGPSRTIEPCTTCGDQPVQVVVPLTAREKIIADKAAKA